MNKINLTPHLTIGEIAKFIEAELVGEGSNRITGVSSFDDAGKDQITFAEDPSFLSRIDECTAGAIILPRTFGGNAGCPILKSELPRLSFFKLVALFHPPVQVRPGISPRAVIGKNVDLGRDITLDANVVIEDHVVIGDHVHIMANCFIGRGCVIGNHTRINPNVTLMEGSRIGVHGLIHSGTVIGSDGYGFAQNAGIHEKLPHTGIVEIGDHVEIGACNTIDKGTLGTTFIGHGVKTDNQVHIAHNVKIGDNTLIVAQVGIAGSSRIGQNVIIAGKAGISGHLTVGNNAIVGPYAGVSSDVPEGKVVSGIPHMPHKTWLRAVNIISRLPEMRKKLLTLEKQMNQGKAGTCNTKISE